MATVATPVETVQPPGLWANVGRSLTWARRLCVGVACVMAFILFLQVAWVYQQAADVNQLLAVGWLILVACGAALVGMPLYRFLRMPRAVEPPPMPEVGAIKNHHLLAEVRYLDRYLNNCTKNVQFDQKLADVATARRELKDLQHKVRNAGSDQTQALSAELDQWTDKRMDALLRDVDSAADKLIYQEALAVGMATAASPNGTLDAFVMLWRSVTLVSKLGVLYYGRPGVWGTLAIFRDVSVAVAVAGYLQNVTDSLGGVVAKAVGGITGVVAGPAVEGTTNAIVLIRIGYLAQQRCRSFRKWDSKTRKSALLASLAATQRVAVGLTTELVRGMRARFGEWTKAMASGLTSAAGSAVEAASDFSASINSFFRRKDAECE